MQCFLNFAHFIKIFIKDYSKITTLLTRLTVKDKFVWNEKVKEASISSICLFLENDYGTIFPQTFFKLIFPNILLNMNVLKVYLIKHEQIKNYK